VLLAEVLLLIFAITTSRVTSQLNENAEDILDKQVENRANYLRQNLIQAQDLNAISGLIDQTTQEMAEEGLTRAQRAHLRFIRRVRRALEEEAVAALARAKEGHDVLEALYHPYVDFTRVQAMWEAEIERLSGYIA